MIVLEILWKIIVGTLAVLLQIIGALLDGLDDSGGSSSGSGGDDDFYCEIRELPYVGNNYSVYRTNLDMSTARQMVDNYRFEFTSQGNPVIRAVNIFEVTKRNGRIVKETNMYGNYPKY